jgi:hypothetical protein
LKLLPLRRRHILEQCLRGLTGNGERSISVPSCLRDQRQSVQVRALENPKNSVSYGKFTEWDSIASSSGPLTRPDPSIRWRNSRGHSKDRSVVGWSSSSPIHADRIAHVAEEHTVPMALQDIADAAGDAGAYAPQLDPETRRVPRVAAEDRATAAGCWVGDGGAGNPGCRGARRAKACSARVARGPRRNTRGPGTRRTHRPPGGLRPSARSRSPTREPT